MLSRQDVWSIVDGYDRKNLVIGSIGSHSALDICDGAKEQGFRTVVICQQGRDRPYRIFKRIVDELILLPKFADVMKDDVQRRLRDSSTIFIPHRSFTTYVSYDDIENNFRVPLFGNRGLLKAEERYAPRNQYYLLEKAGIKMPRLYRDPKDIDGPVMVKIHEAKRKIERAFFTATSYKDYLEKAQVRLDKGVIREDDLNKATIEELLIGTYFNFNFFYSPLDDEVELLGIERRLQTNLHDFVAMPARQQLDLDIPLQNIEVGHTPATVRESLLEKVFEIGTRFTETVKKEYPPGPIGPFALQSIINVDLELVVYDVSPRVPGSPIIATTSPYSKYHHGRVVSTGGRIAMEINKAAKEDRLRQLVT